MIPERAVGSAQRFLATKCISAGSAKVFKNVQPAIFLTPMVAGYRISDQATKQERNSMKTLSMGTRRSSSAPVPGTINFPQRAILELEEPPRDEACARTYFWARKSNYLWAMGAVAIAGLGLHFYYVREMLASLALFSLLFFSVAAVVLECVRFLVRG